MNTTLLKKRTITLLITLACVWGCISAQSPKREFRAPWLTTVWRTDWPKTNGAANQQTEMTKLLDSLKLVNINAICFQVRARCDAFYNSAYEPWSSDLGVTRGTNPGYDPLGYVITEAHKRGIEVHAWLNPYRYETTYNAWTSTTLAGNYRHTQPSWLIQYPPDGSSQIAILNPGIPAVRQRIVDIIKDILGKYDVDGIVFDDYFYVQKIASMSQTDYDNLDNAQYMAYNPKGLSRADWRREQVNLMVKAVYDTIQAQKPYVTFGISPAGVAKGGAAAVGLTQSIASDWQYDGIFSDPCAWLAQGSLDYISPQIYWAIGHNTNDYDQLCNWWSYAAKQFNKHFYSSHTSSSMPSATELNNQIAFNRTYTQNDAPGSIFYNTTGLRRYLPGIQSSKFTNWALAPAIDWKNHPVYSNVSGTGTGFSGAASPYTLSWARVSNISVGAKDGQARYTVYMMNNADPVTYTSSVFANSQNLVRTAYDNGATVSCTVTTSGKTYYVGVLDRYGNETLPVIPSVPVLTLPVNGSTVSRMPKFTWSSDPAATGYILQLSTSSTFATIASTQTITNGGTYSYTYTTNLNNTTKYYARIKASCGIPSGNSYTGWSNVIEFTTSGTTLTNPNTPTITSPTTGATGLLNPVKIIWNPEVQADLGFTVELATNVSFTGATSTNVSGGIYELEYNSLTAGTTYYVRVCAKSSKPFTSGWSNVVSFTVGTPVPPVPTITSPANNTTLTTTSATIQWTSSQGATGYEIELNEASNFTGTKITDMVGSATTQTTFINLTDGKDYWVRVRASYGSPTLYTGWSTQTVKILIRVPIPNTPTITLPAHNSTISTSSVTIKWNLEPNATGYEIEVSDKANFSNVVRSITGLGPTIDQTIFNNLLDGTYYIRIRASYTGASGATYTAWTPSPYVKFTIATPVPSTPVITAPTNGATGLMSPVTVTWNPEPAATGFIVELATNSSFSGATQVNVLAGVYQTTYNPLADGTYYVRVCATYGVSTTYTPWSDPIQFGVSSIPPTPVISSPLNGAELMNPIKVIWSTDARATGYTLELSDNAGFSGATATNVGFVNNTNLATLPAGEYWVRVKANYGASSSTGWSNEVKFEITAVLGQQANIYAYNLKGGEVNALTGEVVLSYDLNAPAATIVIDVPGYTVTPVSVGKARGANTATIVLSPVPPVGSILPWSITATGSPSPAQYAKVVDPANLAGISFANPRGMAVDNNLSSSYFGNVYVSESTVGKKGIYAFDPLLNSLFNSAGGVSWVTSSQLSAGTTTVLANEVESPGRISVAPDGKVYIADKTPTHSGVWRMNPTSPSSFERILDGVRNANGIASNHGPISHCVVTGMEGSEKLYTVDAGELAGSAFGTPTISIKFNEYATLGAGTLPLTNNPTAIFTGHPTAYTANNGGRIQSNSVMIHPSKYGGWWISQLTNAASSGGTSVSTRPGVVFIASNPLVPVFASANLSYTSAWTTTTLSGGYDHPCASGAMAINLDEDLIALAVQAGGFSNMNGGNTIYVYRITYNSSNRPTGIGLAPLYTIDNTADLAAGQNSRVCALAFDRVNNLYAVSEGVNGRIKVYALNTPDNEHTTPAITSESLTVPQIRMSGDYYVPNNPGNGRYFPTLKAACDVINIANITDNITLWVNGNFEEEYNVGLTNTSNYTVTVKSIDPKSKHTVTFSNPYLNTGSAGAFVIGAITDGITGSPSPAKSMMLKAPAATASVITPSPAKNIVLRDLIIKTKSTAHVGNHTIAILGASNNITIDNCTIEHNATGAGTGDISVIYLDALEASGQMPSDILISKNIITNKVPIVSNRFVHGICFYTTDMPAGYSGKASRIKIRGNTITAASRGVFMSNTRMETEISRNTILMDYTANTGYAASAIWGQPSTDGAIYVLGNRMIQLKTSNTTAGAANGMRAITASGVGNANNSNPASTNIWYIDNNYITGFDKMSSGTQETMLVGIRVGYMLACYIRHNTFYLNSLKYSPGNNASTNRYCAINRPVAGSETTAGFFVQNNLFISDEITTPNSFVQGSGAFTNAKNNKYRLSSANSSLATANVDNTNFTSFSNLTSSSLFVNRSQFNLDIAPSVDITEIKVTRLNDVDSDMYGNPRGTGDVTAGAFEAIPLTPTGIDVDVAVDGIRVIHVGNQITIISDKIIQTVNLLDLQGRTIDSMQCPSEKICSLTAPKKGVYILDVLTESGRKIQKVAIQ